MLGAIWRGAYIGFVILLVFAVFWAGAFCFLFPGIAAATTGNFWILLLYAPLFIIFCTIISVIHYFVEERESKKKKKEK